MASVRKSTFVNAKKLIIVASSLLRWNSEGFMITEAISVAGYDLTPEDQCASPPGGTLNTTPQHLHCNMNQHLPGSC